MRKSYEEMMAYVGGKIAQGAETVTFYEITGEIPTGNRSKPFFGDIEDYTELGEALARFDEVIDFGSRSVSLYSVECDGTDNDSEFRTRLIKRWECGRLKTR